MGHLGTSCDLCSVVSSDGGMMMKKVRYFKWLADNKPIYRGGSYTTPGEWQRPVVGKLEPCVNGYHVMTRNQVSKWRGTQLIEVEIDPVDMIVEENKCVVRSWREIKRFAWSRSDMVDCAYTDAARFLVRLDAAAFIEATAAAEKAITAAVNDAIFTARLAATHAAAASVGTANCASPPGGVTTTWLDVYTAERERQLLWIENRIGESLS